MLVCAPHTSLWDAVFLLIAGNAVGLRLRWMTKAEALRPPFGWLLRRFGAIPVERDRPHGLVAQMVQVFADSSDLVLAIAPSGTRSKREGWRSGFHSIARGAGVPMVPAYLDYRRRTVGFGAPMVASADIDVDVEQLRSFFDGVEGRHPEMQTPIRIMKSG